MDIAVDQGISGAVRGAICWTGGAASAATRARSASTNGPEFTSRSFIVGARQTSCTLVLIEAGKPTQNAYIESFNGKFRDECLNEHWFVSLTHARA